MQEPLRYSATERYRVFLEMRLRRSHDDASALIRGITVPHLTPFGPYTNHPYQMALC